MTEKLEARAASADPLVDSARFSEETSRPYAVKEARRYDGMALVREGALQDGTSIKYWM
ncbi:MAG TPA: hypothetical protein VHA12_00045 [Candidatus Nanoarchaeia archaeon]|nr:hypothetical protein [Candidatus Nanoarchaeia archaeon]